MLVISNLLKLSRRWVRESFDKSEDVNVLDLEFFPVILKKSSWRSKSSIPVQQSRRTRDF